jgi:hypothetical protein
VLSAAAPAFCSGGDSCTSFCTLELQACGSLQAPLPGNPKDPDGNPLYQYENLATCMIACAGFDKTHVYSTAAVGDSLACRMIQATRAAVSVPNGAMFCAATAESPLDACAGTATP